MSVIGTTYSYKDTAGAFDSPAVGAPLVFGGQIGADTITVTNDTQHGTKDTAADGTVMPSFVAGDSGVVTIVCQQTSIVHKYLLAWLNILKTAAMNGDVSNWANTRMLLRNTLDGTAHDIEGVMPNKIPDKSYAANGQKITWTLEACNIVSV
jgi:hypothetical protein